jgi:flagellar protein FliS
MMSSAPQPNKYLEATLQTATSAQLLIMTYDAAIRFCRLAIESINHKEYNKAHYNLCKVQDIVSEFIISLDKDAPVAEDLLRLYEYFQRRLTEANTKKLVEPVEEILNYLIDLKETWVQAAKLAGAAKNATS